MRASPDFQFWTPEDAMQFIRRGIRFAGGGYKSRMAKAGRSRAYLYFVDAEVESHRFRKVGLCFSSNPIDRDPKAYKRVHSCTCVKLAEADPFETACLAWLDLQLKPKPLPVKVRGWAGASEAINSMNKDVPSLFEEILRRCQAFAADNNPVWIKRDLVLMGELALAIKRPELVSSCSPTFKRYWDEFAACIDRTEIP